MSNKLIFLIYTVHTVHIYILYRKSGTIYTVYIDLARFSYGRGRSRSLLPCPAMSTLTSCLACTVRLQHTCVRPCALQIVTSHHHNYLQCPACMSSLLSNNLIFLIYCIYIPNFPYIYCIERVALTCTALLACHVSCIILYRECVAERDSFLAFCTLQASYVGRHCLAGSLPNGAALHRHWQLKFKQCGHQMAFVLHRSLKYASLAHTRT
jgi:hypothetical protein